MSTTSQHLGLKIPDGNDPFLREDFVDNYNLIDSYPGLWPCTSTTRPTWGSGQAGMAIIELDTRRPMLWDGTSFRQVLVGPAAWWGSLRPGVNVGKGTTSSYVVGSFTVSRPGTLLGINTVELGGPGDGYTEGNIRVMIDGSLANWDGSTHGEYFKYDNKNTAHTANQDAFCATYPSLGARTVAAGTHTIGFQVQIPNYSTINTLMRITSCRSLVIFTDTSDK